MFQPYAFDGIVSLDERFTADLTYLTDVNSGGNVPWVVQWIDRTPLWFPLQSAFWWGMGPALALAVAAGVALAVRDIVRYRRYELLVPLVLVAVMLGLVSQQFNPLIRYLLPAYPVAIALAGAAVVRAFDVGRRMLAARPAVGRALQVGAVGVVALTAFWGVAFVNGVYAQEHPRIEASTWMAENLPADAAISAQIWDDALPLAVAGTEGFAPTLVSFDPFAPDASVDPETGRTKVEELLADLDEVDYVVEASNRIYDSVARVPAKYPATTAYYDALFDGRLGFERVARFRNQPSLFGIDLPSHDAEETFTVYDHPTVTIWAKTDAFSVDRARSILNPSRCRARTRPGARRGVDQRRAAATRSARAGPGRRDVLRGVHRRRRSGCHALALVVGVDPARSLRRAALDHPALRSAGRPRVRAVEDHRLHHRRRPRLADDGVGHRRQRTGPVVVLDGRVGGRRSERMVAPAPPPRHDGCHGTRLVDRGGARLLVRVRAGAVAAIGQPGSVGGLPRRREADGARLHHRDRPRPVTCPRPTRGSAAAP